MQSVGLHDDIKITCSRGGAIRAVSDSRTLPEDRRNTAVRAAEVFFGYTGITGWGAELEITKRIPVCAGMGGGSADAAAALRGLNELFSTGLSAERLEELGGDIGSDVPFCVSGGTALAEGRGERLTRLPGLPPCGIVICKPQFSVSTQSLFERLDCGAVTRRPDTAGIIKALREQRLADVASRMYNIFEDVSPYSAETARAKERLLELGALGAVMTGTGSAVFGVFGDNAAARAAYDAARRDYEGCYVTAAML
jgi:4-diphosphocytidyl-2-C-methyl-D-erythritol kinase